MSDDDAPFVHRLPDDLERLPVSEYPLHPSDANWACQLRQAGIKPTFDFRCTDCRSEAIGYLDAGNDLVTTVIARGFRARVCLSELVRFTAPMSASSVLGAGRGDGDHGGGDATAHEGVHAPG